jgi:lycopene beta-cyclase
MSIDQLDTKHLTQIAVIGDGCAALSLASKADLLPKYQLHVIAPKMHLSEQDHIWGLWQMDWLQDVVPLARKTWHKWAIINHNTKVVMQANEHPYQAVTRRSWLAHCKRKAQQNKVSFHETIADIGTLPLRQIFDSRPPKQKSGMMLQHFIGWEVRADPGSFDDKIAILMDFRCDQSRGMHFIYFLPFSNSDALVESFDGRNLLYRWVSWNRMIQLYRGLALMAVLSGRLADMPLASFKNRSKLL